MNLQVINSVKELLLSQFPYMIPAFLDDMIERVTVNQTPQYNHYLFVAERRGEVLGAAIASQFLKENFFS